MPLVKVMNLSREQTSAVAKNILGDIATIAEVDESRFHFFHCGDSVFEDSLVLIEVLWYPRDKSKMKSVAELLYNELKKHGNYNVDVVFHELNSEKHYINGEQHFPKK